MYTKNKHSVIANTFLKGLIICFVPKYKERVV